MRDSISFKKEEKQQLPVQTLVTQKQQLVLGHILEKS
jgi:hypothetical protein